ncbi:26623_t:CDS:2 [Gigaspora margarita]|uniref:26623_t:CDS:1 n=1 Tax=Gigaspora margarita TaxID=4874 RepID=A0ABN7UXX0_GIGMA|nr:26623_t:CDS:2 [Gigaspora margarita]
MLPYALHFLHELTDISILTISSYIQANQKQTYSKPALLDFTTEIPLRHSKPYLKS